MDILALFVERGGVAVRFHYIIAGALQIKSQETVIDKLTGLTEIGRLYSTEVV